MERQLAWLNEAKWFLVGVLLALSALAGFFLIWAIPPFLLGLSIVVYLAGKKVPGTWMLLVGIGVTISGIYAVDLFLDSGKCPYSNTVFPVPGGALRCGPPDRLRIFQVALGVTALFLGPAIWAYRRRK